MNAQERRVDPEDGNAYTREEFIDAYGAGVPPACLTLRGGGLSPQMCGPNARRLVNCIDWPGTPADSATVPCPGGTVEWDAAGARLMQEAQQRAMQQQQQQQAQLQVQMARMALDAGNVGAEERRVDPEDGQAYTRAEFIDAYGGTAEWDAAGARSQLPTGAVRYAVELELGPRLPPLALAFRFLDGALDYCWWAGVVCPWSCLCVCAGVWGTMYAGECGGGGGGGAPAHARGADPSEEGGAEGAGRSICAEEEGRRGSEGGRGAGSQQQPRRWCLMQWRAWTMDVGVWATCTRVTVLSWPRRSRLQRPREWQQPRCVTSCRAVDRSHSPPPTR
eukprot:COSAG01_NODE_4841_length_4692_cov_66.837361_5_plen_334_part_00